MACLQPPWFSSLRVVSPAKLKAGPPSATNKPAKPLCWAVGPDNAESSEPDAPKPVPDGPVDPVKLAFSKAEAYKESIKPNSGLGTTQSAADNNDDNEAQKDLPDSVKIATEKAKKYKQNKGVAAVSETTQGRYLGVSDRSSGKNVMDNKVGKKGELSVSRMDFAGLGFVEKKTTRGLPPGLVPISEPFFDGDLPEVELIVGDTSKFDDATTPEPEQTNKEDEAELYKPKVSTWGVFPRPGNISKTFGGGRVIRLGEVLETEEEKAVKEARTEQLHAADKKKVGLNVDPKLKYECEESELHGLAALQWSICQDSLSRSNETRGMYEKLKSHPNPKVSKKARQFMYSFQAMEMMKVTTGSQFYLKNSDYQNYFDAFVENKSNYPEDGLVQESAMNQVLPYILFLVSPIFVVLLIAVRKGT
ncbi:uncharacterized protein LOC114378242 [Glycine soja]|uniref:uncharacterized protein LOC114378242 n=1 Tax=Glycine soja TaxID=3848 RepID=UPI00103B4C52|nr:uncharacterized protein LOC114378242 [Glycine soja]